MVVASGAMPSPSGDHARGALRSSWRIGSMPASSRQHLTRLAPLVHACRTRDAVVRDIVSEVRPATTRFRVSGSTRMLERIVGKTAPAVRKGTRNTGKFCYCSPGSTSMRDRRFKSAVHGKVSHGVRARPDTARGGGGAGCRRMRHGARRRRPGAIVARAVVAINATLMNVERADLRREGLPGRPHYRNTTAALRSMRR